MSVKLSGHYTGGQYANVHTEKQVGADAAALKILLLAAYDRNTEMEGRPIAAARSALQICKLCYKTKYKYSCL